MSVRDRGYDPRKTHPRSGAHPLDGAPPVPVAGARRASSSSGNVPKFAVGAAAAAVLLIAVFAGVGLSGGFHFGSPAASAGPSQAAFVGGSPSSSGGAATQGTPSDSAAPSASTDPSSSTPPTISDDTVAFVPVTSFRSGRTAAKAADVSGIAAGTSPYTALIFVKADAASEIAALKVDAAALGTKLIKVATADKLMSTIAAHRTYLGFLRADQVGPGVKALSWGGKSLFGEKRVASLDEWPLHAQLAVSSDNVAYNPASAWTIFAAGDLALDRGAALAIKKHGNDPNYLYSGGTVTITGHCKDCSPFGWDLPYTKRTGNLGAMRALIKGADLSLANMEEVAVKHYVYHPHGTVFTGNPAYLPGVVNAGFDWVSMGNNHVGDFGPAGVIESMGLLTKAGLKHGGAGKNITDAHKPSIMTVNGIKVAVLSYDTVADVYNATDTKAGSARMTNGWLKHDIKAARAAGAKVVIVWPHWGVEYTAGPSLKQQTLAHNAIDAGADLVIGNHPHWAQAMEVYKGRPIWYALGNFTFDQTWSEPTMEGISLELTFSGTKLVQAWMHPHLVLDYAQPNLLDPMGSGKAVFKQIFDASKDLAW
jgi:hypothetical protein